MEIENATDFTISALTLKEKSLARSFLRNEQYRRLSNAVWLRAPSLNLSKALAQARAGAAKQKESYKAKFINLYCDTLVIDEGTEIVPEQEGGRDVQFVIEIFARKVVCSLKADAGVFHVRFTKESEILFWVPQLPSGFQFTILSPDGKERLFTPAIEPGSFGIDVQYEDPSQGPSSKPLRVPDVALQNINYMDIIGKDGKLLDKGFRNDDFPRLLQFQMLVAQANTSLNRTLALELLDFIIAATATPKGAHIYYQATALRSKLTIYADIMSVPSVNIYSSKQILKSRLLAAMAFEQAFRDFLLEAGTRSVQADTALNMLAKSNDAIQTYDFLKYIRQREFDNAVLANEKAEKTFKQTQFQLEELGNKFQDGIVKWKKEQITSAVKDILLGIVKVGVAIGATVATGGAAALTVVAAAGGMMSTGGKVAQLVAKLKGVFDKVNKIYKKIKPVIEKLQEVVKTIQTVVKALKDFNEATAGTQDLKPKVLSTDVFNATAEWRRFDIIVREMEKSLDEYKDIDGKDAYFRALKIMVVDGETYILTQANLVQKGDELATVIVQQQMERREETRLTATATNVTNDTAVLDILTRAMFDRILAIRSMVYLDFFTYTEAYRYHTLSNEPIVTLSPVKPVVDYLEDAAKLQGAVAAFGSRVMVQQRTFQLKTLGGFDNAQGLAQAISTGESVSVTVRPDEALWNGFVRIRLSRVRCWFEGLKLSSSGSDSKLPLRVELRNEAQFFDRDLDTSVAAGEDVVLTTRSFLGATRTLVFEYRPDSNAIVCDGYFGYERDYTKHTPMTNWAIKLVEHSADTLVATDLDFSAFEGIALEFLCDFTWKEGL